MVKRISLVRVRSDVSREQALAAWLGPHADVVRRMPAVRQYVVDVASEPRPPGAWDAVATLRFDSRKAADEALSEHADALARTRRPFLEAVDVMFVDEHVVVPLAGSR
jgi:uncharacterized protein (TIGR02118 family)